MDHAETGEDAIAANDAKNVEARRASYSNKKPNPLKRFFEV